jgi:actin-related protein
MEYALQDGLISNWDHLERLWDHALSSSLKVDIKETPVLLSEKSYNSSSLRQKYPSLRSSPSPDLRIECVS